MTQDLKPINDLNALEQATKLELLRELVKGYRLLSDGNREQMKQFVEGLE